MDKRNLVGLIVLSVILVLIVGPILIIGLGHGCADTGDRQRRLELLHTANIAQGYLENEKYQDAIPLLEKVVQSLPKEPLGYRNWTIAQLESASLDQDPSRKAQSLAHARQGVDKLIELAPYDAVNHQLRSRVAEAIGNPEAARSELLKATELAPHDATLWFDLGNLERQAKTEAMEPFRKAGIDHLERAASLAPGNLAAASTFLLALVDGSDRRVGAALQRYVSLLPPPKAMTPALEPRLVSQLERLIAEVPSVQNDPEAASGIARSIINFTVILPTWQADLRRIKLHNLALVATRFDDSFYRNLGIQTAADTPVHFTDITSRVGLAAIAGVRDLAWVDLDLDRKLDVVTLEAGPPARVRVYLWRNGTYAADAVPPVVVPARTLGIRLGAIDRALPNAPELLDVLAFGLDGVRLFHTERTGQAITLADITTQAGLAGVGAIRWATFFDIDQDGTLDLVMGGPKGAQIWRNRGDRRFVNISDQSHLPPAGWMAAAAIFGDFDRDGTDDLALVSASGELGLMVNHRLGRLDFQAAQVRNPLTADTAEAITAFDPEDRGELMVSTGGRWFTPQTAANHPIWPENRGLSLPRSKRLVALAPLDFDNDGFTDLIGLTGRRGDPVRLYRNIRNERSSGSDPNTARAFQDVSIILPREPAPMTAVATGDFDADGDIDVLLGGPDGVRLWRNDGGNTNHWVDLRLKAAPAVTPNEHSVTPQAIGSLVEMKSANNYQMQTARGPVVHFGLDGLQQVDMIRVTWTDGVPQDAVLPKLDHSVINDGQCQCYVQRPKGSCPYLYAWDGRRFRFVTDLLWNSPLGLPMTDDSFVPCFKQEWLKIRGDQLRPRDGAYVLQVTEELWEVGYFDHVELLTVDHPADVEIFSNEKVQPPPAPEFRIHTVRRRRDLRAARDQAGRDVLPLLTRADGRYVGGFARTGLPLAAEPHWIELDLGDLGASDRLTLFLTAWSMPSGSSLNLAATRRSDLTVAPPALAVDLGHGRWQTILPFMPFPPGRPKTAGLDLRGKIPPAARHHCRLRISTTWEVYWDEIFFTTGEQPDTRLVVTPLQATSADLHFRGWSVESRQRDDQPWIPDYPRRRGVPQWLPIAGRYTRYGDVLPLVAAADDRLAILASGDEMTLRFRVADAPPLPPGWRRDFLIHSVGYDKDGDFNTVTGDRVEPLPFRAMTAYPYPRAEHYPDDPPHREYQARYNTRTVSAEPFRNRVRDFRPAQAE